MVVGFVTSVSVMVGVRDASSKPIDIVGSVVNSTLKSTGTGLGMESKSAVGNIVGTDVGGCPDTRDR
jgi:hypothetical protein